MKNTTREARVGRVGLTPFNLPIPGWNERKMTSADFEQVCEREGITVHRQPLPGGVRGLYTRVDGQPHIYIRASLKGSNRVRSEFHELAHHFLHGRDRDLKVLASKFDQKLTDPQEWAEVEATAAACVALAPGFSLLSLIQIVTGSASRYNWKGGAK
jgi:Zn-dependent peptidase ImmA (M78 family)